MSLDIKDFDGFIITQMVNFPLRANPSKLIDFQFMIFKIFIVIQIIG